MIYAKKKNKRRKIIFPAISEPAEKSKGGICKLVKSSSSDLVT